MNPRIEIGKIIIGLAEYYEKQLTPTQIDMYVEDLMDLPPGELLQAIRLYRKDSTNDRFPLPGKLRAMIYPPDIQRGREAAARIWTAISKIGNYENERAHEYIGELGWEVVKLQGGWEEVCRISDDDKVNAQAQWRELAVSLINKHRLGISDEPPSLEFKPKKSGSLENLGSIFQIKKVEQK